MKITVFGMGYVGCVSAACLADMGHEIWAVEPNPTKIKMINEGKTPIIEVGLEALILKAIQEKRLHATTDCAVAIQETSLAFVCVGTPSQANGSVELGFVQRVCEQIGAALATKRDYFTVVIRSTISPGTMEDLVIPTLQKHSGKKAGIDFGVCMNPEFLREGTSIADFYNPPKTVIGEFDARSGEALVELCKGLPGPLLRTELRVAEMVKLADNTFHAVKICFANEIGNICQSVGVDSHAVMDIFCKDTKLNLSPYYLKPGFAFGGSCLPKDLRSVSYQARKRDVATPLLNSVLPSNEYQIQKVIQKLQTFKGRSLGFFGLSFKEDTDDLRESPIVEVIEAMIGKGFKIGIHDRNVSMARLMGANKEFIEKEIPHISDLLAPSAQELVKKSDILIVSLKSKEYGEALRQASSQQVIIDLVRLFSPKDHPSAQYYGICW